MDDLISRQAVYDVLDNIKIPRNASWYLYYQQALNAVNKLQSAKPENPKGKWIPVTSIYKATKDEFPYMHIEWVDSTDPDKIDGLRCSECGTVYDFTEARNWCSECGADMRGEENE